MDRLNLAFVVTDDSNNIAILSGIYDDENSWEFVDNLIVNKNIPDICVDILENGYKYSISCRKSLRISIKTIDLETDISETIDITELINELSVCDDVIIDEHTGNTHKLRANILGNNFKISEVNINLMRGKRKNIYIEF